MHIKRWLVGVCIAAVVPGLFMGVAAWAQMAHSDAGCDGCHTPHNADALPESKKKLHDHPEP